MRMVEDGSRPMISTSRSSANTRSVPEASRTTSAWTRSAIMPLRSSRVQLSLRVRTSAATVNETWHSYGDCSRPGRPAAQFRLQRFVVSLSVPVRRRPECSVELTLDYNLLLNKGLVRERNEDRCVAFEPDEPDVREERGRLFVLADGMGGHAAGDVAAETAITTVRDA